MLRKLHELTQYSLEAGGVRLGAVEDLFYDDRAWTVRYLVTSLGQPPAERKVLVSPIALGKIDDTLGTVPVRLSTDQLFKSPQFEAIVQLTRKYEADYHRYFGWPMYWAGDERWGSGPFPTDIALPRPAGDPDPSQDENGRYLKSTRDLMGFRMEARDGDIGRVSDFIFSDETWEIRFMVVRTGDFLHGREVLVSPRWIDQISWMGNVLVVDIPRDTISRSPEYDPFSVVTRDYELRLHRHYVRENTEASALSAPREPALKK